MSDVRGSQTPISSAFAQGAALHERGQLAAAERIYEDILRREPNHFDALHLLGVVSAQTQRTQRGIDLIRRAIALNSGVAEAHNNLGSMLLGLGRFEEALVSFDKAIALTPRFTMAHLNRGIALSGLGRHLDALISFERVIVAEPGSVDAHTKKGLALRNLKRADEALLSVDRAIGLRSNHMEAHFERGNILSELKRYDEALASYDRITGSPAALYNRGNLLATLNRFQEALVSYDQAIALKPDHGAAHDKRGRTLYELWRYEEALSSFDKALLYGIVDATIHGNRGKVLAVLDRFDEALAAFDKAFALDPALLDEGSRFAAKSHICDWTDFASDCAELRQAVTAGNAAIMPFLMLGIPSSPGEQLLCARQWTAKKYVSSNEPLWRGEQYGHRRIRLAYLSSDFHEHATAYLTAGMFEWHDRTRFETVALSWDGDDGSEIRRRLEASFERFVDVQSLNDAEVARSIREMEIDILVDLKGFTKDCRTGVLGRRPAPIQVNYLGFPGTMGAPFMDYIIADRVVIPEQHRDFYQEKVVTLPDSYQVNDNKRQIGRRQFTREEAGLPSNGFVFCSFNNSYKINPSVFDCWMRILSQVDGSVLWLLEPNSGVAGNVRREAAARGIAPHRLVFAPKVAVADHLARHSLADLFLDTIPCNAHTTASDALWAGLPVLTILGETFAGRVAASLLNAVGLPELVADTIENYQRMAIDVALHPDRVAGLKTRLSANRGTAPLFDTKHFTMRIETAYQAMYERYRLGLAPADIVVPA